MPGETGAVTVSCPIAMTMAAFFGISAYNVLEIQVSIFNVFKRRRCLYFWSMEVASWTILMHGLPIFLRFFALAPKLPMCVLIVIGRWGMITGQSVVLYSRLQLVVEDARRIRWVLYMIIFNFFALQIPTSILFFGENLGYLPFLPAFNIYERLQLTGLCLQESIISGLYIWEGSHDPFDPGQRARRGRGRQPSGHRVFGQLRNPNHLQTACIERQIKDGVLRPEQAPGGVLMANSSIFDSSLPDSSNQPNVFRLAPIVVSSGNDANRYRQRNEGPAQRRSRPFPDELEGIVPFPMTGSNTVQKSLCRFCLHRTLPAADCPTPGMKV